MKKKDKKNRKGQLIIRFTPSKIKLEASDNFSIEQNEKQKYVLMTLCTLIHSVMENDEKLIDLIIAGQQKSGGLPK